MLMDSSFVITYNICFSNPFLTLTIWIILVTTYLLRLVGLFFKGSHRYSNKCVPLFMNSKKKKMNRRMLLVECGTETNYPLVTKYS